jgi:hypothetical protein
VIKTAAGPMRGSDTDGPMTDGQSAGDTLGAMAELLRDSRPALVVSGAATSAVIVGVAVEEAVLPMNLHAGAGSVVCAAMFAVLVVSVIRTVSLMITASRPLLDELGELRRLSGAQIDPRAPWTPVRRPTAMSPVLWRERVQAVLAAAHFRSLRVHLALGWAAVAVISFFAWTLATLIVAGRI